MPGPWLRRPVTVAVSVLIDGSCLAAAPLLLGLGVLVAVVTGDRRLLIMTRIFLVYFARELTTLAACAALWLLSGAGALTGTRTLQALHWRLLGWFVGGVAGAVQRELELRVVQEAGSATAAEALAGTAPLLVFSRHAGPADTILLIDRLIFRFGRRPSVVFKQAVALDPAVDLLSGRLPHAVLDLNDPAEARRAISDTTAALGARGVLLLFPEGGNFTAPRRRSVLRSLRRRGLRTAATRAEQLHHVLPPRPAGAIAALDAAPLADVVFAAHTGLGLAAYPLQIYRELPVRATMHTRMWHVPRAEVPLDEDGRCAWLNEWWRRIDAWIGDEHADGDTATGAAV
ncbi:MAG: 1-acyl-sn-glycerol-3-phosphate acyltransferase [Solirubrobacteraceae bacterium]